MRSSRSRIVFPCYLIAALSFTAAGCDLTDPEEFPVGVVIGLNFETTGQLADVGRQAGNAAILFVNDRNATGGIVIGGEKHRLDMFFDNNGGLVERAVAEAEELIDDYDVLALVGPNPSNLAIAAGAVANERETPMISPWSTNPATTKDRPYVFRAAFLDTFQGPVLANFATDEYGASTACILYDENNDYPRGLAESFRAAWQTMHGASSVAAYESIDAGSEDYTAQLEVIQDAGCDVMFVPLYAHEVAVAVLQAHAMGIGMPILGADSWGTPALLTECGVDCEGYYFSAHYIVAGATGATKTFIDKYRAEYGEDPGDVAALTWDALLIVEEAMRRCGTITGNLAADRECIRDGMAAISNFPGITGTLSFNSDGDPVKCAIMGRIQNGAFVATEPACP